MPITGGIPSRTQGGVLVATQMGNPFTTVPNPVPPTVPGPAPTPNVPNTPVTDPSRFTIPPGFTIPTGPNVNPAPTAPPAQGAPPAGPAPSSPALGPTVPSVIPPPTNPLAGFDINQIMAQMQGMVGSMNAGTTGTFTPGTADTSVNPLFEQTLQERIRGEGSTMGPSFNDIISGVYNPMSQLIDQNYQRSVDMAAENMISRGILDSSEAGRTMGDLAIDLANNRSSLLGSLGLQFEEQRQNAINSALANYGILEGNRIQARTTITAANIGAAAQIQSASLAANATQSAAMIGAQARLQEAGLNANVALAQLQGQMDRSLIEQGIDPWAFANDGEYRGGVFQYFEDMRWQERILMGYIIEEASQRASAGSVA